MILWCTPLYGFVITVHITCKLLWIFYTSCSQEESAWENLPLCFKARKGEMCITWAGLMKVLRHRAVDKAQDVESMIISFWKQRDTFSPWATAQCNAQIYNRLWINSTAKAHAWLKGSGMQGQKLLEVARNGARARRLSLGMGLPTLITEWAVLSKQMMQMVKWRSLWICQ